MKKDVVITVRGLQPQVDAEEAVEVMSAGTYMRKDSTHYLSYEEADENGNITKNRIKITPSSIEMTKQGGIATQMLFLLGEKQFACYETPFGELNLGMHTKHIAVREEEKKLFAELRYGLDINGEYVSDCELDITVKEIAGQSSCDL